MGRGISCVYWILIVLGSILLFARDQEFEALKIVFCVGLPIAVVWGCWTIFRLLFGKAASMFADARVALSNLVTQYPRLPNRLKIAAGLAAVMVASFFYFAGLVDLNSSGLQNSLLATP